MTHPFLALMSRRPVSPGCCVDPRRGFEVSSWHLFDSIPDGTDVCEETKRQWHARRWGKCPDVEPPQYRPRGGECGGWYIASGGCKIPRRFLNQPGLRCRT